MAITTNSANIGTINADYPVAGQDNDSQGFRDNFTKIKTELTNAHADLTSLDTNTVKSNDAITNMQGNTIQNVVFNNSAHKYYSGGTITVAGNRPMSHEIGTYHHYTVNIAGVTLQPTDWPTSGKYAEMVVEIKRGGDVLDTSTTFNVSFSNPANGGVIKVVSTSGSFPHPAIIDNAAHPVVYRFWTIDGGATVYGEYLGDFNTVL